MIRRTILAAFILYASALSATAQDVKDTVAASIESKRSTYADVARQLWSFAELGYQEMKSSSLLQTQLKAAGFDVQAGVAEMPTAFVAAYGKGKPVVAILAEFDALPGLSQDALPERRPIVEHGPGHACGHHLFGTASTAAAIAVKDWLARSGTTGTVRLYGTPAEEGGGGKIYMVRAGLFDDVDAVLHWHPNDSNDASPLTSLAFKSAKFRFYGISSHAARFPDRGRSALDGVEAMDYMVNMIREHIPSDARIHYVITHGGAAPNVVPDFAEVYYYVRHPDTATLEDIWARVVRVSEGAALGTGTRVEHEVIAGMYSLLPNETLSRLMDGNLRRVGGVKYTSEERAFAETIRKTFGNTDLLLGSEEEIQPCKLKAHPTSTDVGDISWVIPTARVRTATWVPGTASHSWQAVAAGGMTIGAKGMIVAAKVIALTAVDLFTDPSHVKEARAEVEQRRGKDFRYQSLLGDRKPPLDYMNKEK
jgi:aminobenzoyl-glutamate utilization protein B